MNMNRLVFSSIAAQTGLMWIWKHASCHVSEFSEGEGRNVDQLVNQLCCSSLHPLMNKNLMLEVVQQLLLNLEHGFQPFMASALEEPTLFTTSSSTKKHRPATRLHLHNHPGDKVLFNPALNKHTLTFWWPQNSVLDFVCVVFGLNDLLMMKLMFLRPERTLHTHWRCTSTWTGYRTHFFWRSQQFLGRCLMKPVESLELPEEELEIKSTAR